MILPFLFECRSLILILERYVMGDYLLRPRYFQRVSEIKPVLFSALCYAREPTRWEEMMSLLPADPADMKCQ
ncbi:MAG: hypothetical protein P8H99_06400 [Luminiphilus sp.]|nr:hypothetical protein [Luminiphilus sp.]